MEWLILSVLGFLLLQSRSASATTPAPTTPAPGLGLGGAPGLGLGGAPVPAPLVSVPGVPGAPAPMPPLVNVPGVPGVPGATPPAPVSPLASAEAGAVLGQLVATPTSLAALLQALISNPTLAPQLLAAAPALAAVAQQLLANPGSAQAIGTTLGANSQASMELLRLLTTSPQLLALARQALQFPQGGPGLLQTLTYGLIQIVSGQLPRPDQVLPGGATGPLAQVGLPQPATAQEAASVLGQLVARPAAALALLQQLAAQPALAAQLAAQAPQLAAVAQQVLTNPGLAANAGTYIAQNSQASMQLLGLLSSSPQLLAMARQVLAAPATTPGAAGTPAPGGGLGLGGIAQAGLGLLGQILGGAPPATTPPPTAPPGLGAAPPAGTVGSDAQLAAESLATLASAGAVRWGVTDATVRALQQRMGGVRVDGEIGPETARRVHALIGWRVWDDHGNVLPPPAGRGATTTPSGVTVTEQHGQADTLAGLILSAPDQRLPVVIRALTAHPAVLYRLAQRAPRLAALGQQAAAGGSIGAALTADQTARAEMVAALREDAELRGIVARALGVG